MLTYAALASLAAHLALLRPAEDACGANADLSTYADVC